MQSDLINKYNTKELFDLAFKYLRKIIVNEYYSLNYLEDEYISLYYIKYKVLHLELYKDNLIFYDYVRATRTSILNIKDISNCFIDRFGNNIGRKFLIYAQCNLI